MWRRSTFGQSSADRRAPIPTPALILPNRGQARPLLALDATQVAMLPLGSSPTQQNGGMKSSCPRALGRDARPPLFALGKNAGQPRALLSSDGRFKTPAESKHFLEASPRAATVLEAQGRIRKLCRGVSSARREDLLVASSTGRMLRLVVNDATVPLMGKDGPGACC